MSEGNPQLSDSELKRQILYHIDALTSITPSEHVRLLEALCEGLIRGDEERQKDDDLAAEFVQFRTMFEAKPSPGSSDGADLAFRYMFRLWATKSPNRFARVYQLGRSQASVEIKTRNVKRAANGRRLIGASSRSKIAKASEGMRHLSKENAARELASIVNLDPGTIRRYLSQLFPGDDWKKV